jgi:hypothetical protein
VTTERPPEGRDEKERRGPGERDETDRERRRLERILPELIKRILEAGYEKIAEGPENVRHFIGEMKLPKEALSLIFAQLDETKNGLYRVVAGEIRDFLEHTNLAEELAKVLTTLSFEVKTEVRFIPNDAKINGLPKPEVRARVRMKKDRRSVPPSEPSATSDAAPGASGSDPETEEDPT